MILIENGTARLFVGNELVAKTDELLAHPREVASVANYLARSQDGKVLFEGMLDDFKVYSTALLIDKAWAKTIAPPFQTNLIPVGNTQTVTVRVNRLDGVDIPGVVLINYGDGWKEMTHVSSTGNSLYSTIVGLLKKLELSSLKSKQQTISKLLKTL